MADVKLPEGSGQPSVIGSPDIDVVVFGTGENRRRVLAQSDVLPTTAGTHGTLIPANFALGTGVHDPYVGGNELQVSRKRQFVGHVGYICLLYTSPSPRD